MYKSFWRAFLISCQAGELKGMSDWIWAKLKTCGISHKWVLKEIRTPPSLVGCGYGSDSQNDVQTAQLLVLLHGKQHLESSVISKGNEKKKHEVLWWAVSSFLNPRKYSHTLFSPPCLWQGTPIQPVKMNEQILLHELARETDCVNEVIQPRGCSQSTVCIT